MWPGYRFGFLINLFLYSWIHNDLRVGFVGPKVDLTYDYEVQK